MNRVIGIILGAGVTAGLLGLIGWSLMSRGASSAEYDQYDANTVMSENEQNGGIADHIMGNENAKVVIYEYADYQCPGCASVFSFVEELLDKYGDDLAIVYRTYLLSYHQNGRSAASAAEAAGLQGYWKEYHDLLFQNQSEWEDAEGSDLTELYAKYFETASGGAGDVEQFKSDTNLEKIDQKIDFDVAMAEQAGLEVTPSFFLDGELIDWSGAEATTKDKFIEYFSEKIDAKLAE